MRTWTFVAVCCLSGCLLPSGGITDPMDDESGESGGDTTTNPTTGTGPDDTSTGPGPGETSTGPAPTSGPGDVCGDGSLSGDEECDNGADNADDAPCLSDCKLATCGDGFVLAGGEQCDDGSDNAEDAACLPTCMSNVCGDGFVLAGTEVCDDGTNDGSYGGCMADCSDLGPHCGDDTVDDPQEECDSAADPSCLSSCKLARSCLLLHEADPGLPTGVRTIYPTTPDAPLNVYCDMDADGGGYTFLKVDIDNEMNDLPYPAKSAEVECSKHGMQLWIPRSPEHVQASYMAAIGDNVPPLGGGSQPSGSDYMQIAGVYPVMIATSCPGMAPNLDDCPQWAASDDGEWYISDMSNSAIEPDPDGACAECSMTYTWNLDGSVKKYVALPTGGASLRFFCDVGDKLP